MVSLVFAPLARPHASLSIAFVFWKIILLLIAIISPGPGYDLSTHQLLGLDKGGPNFVAEPWIYIASKLTRWDAIYYVSIARHGYVWEQAWAFSWGWTQMIRFVSRPFVDKANDSLVKEALVGIALAHLAHYASVIVLYRLSLRLTAITNRLRYRLALTTALLHIICPAGLFMCAPYGEPLTSLLSFLGLLLYVQESPGSTILSGLILGLACMIRSNIILHGSIYLWDVFGHNLPCLFQTWRNRHKEHVKDSEVIMLTAFIDACASIAAGLLLAVGLAIPQVIAYLTWCTPFPEADRREWCFSIPPSIFTYVQKRYWNNGFLAYWTVSNLPLFLIAAPMLTVMIWSAVHALQLPMQGKQEVRALQRAQRGRWAGSKEATSGAKDQGRIVRQLKVLAVPQLLLAILDLSNFHVQIITRLATAYPLLYFWLASNVQSQGQATSDLPLWSKRANKLAKAMVRFSVMYAMIQGGLFASFLPPA